MTDITPIVIDIETCAHPDAALYLEPVQAARNLKDPAKIAADIAEREADRASRLGLDWNVGRVVCIGWWTEQDGVDHVVARTESDERDVLHEFWAEAKARTIIGFGLKQFDLPFLIQRSRLLGVKAPWLDLGKYTQKGVIDLFLELTFFEGARDQGAMRRTLKAFAKRFGLPVPDETNGSDIQSLVTAGDWDAIAAHCRADVELTVGLAKKLGHLREAA
jgi:predicted PolB exonuclease-like 3'-5' exonuclease